MKKSILILSTLCLTLAFSCCGKEKCNKEKCDEKKGCAEGCQKECCAGKKADTLVVDQDTIVEVQDSLAN
ncbi:MAG: hypothetical protein H6604_01235 [Flavobacteriales bacterium]|nr:hypothetical protein [Flavobacteriales bacterium]